MTSRQNSNENDQQMLDKIGRLVRSVLKKTWGIDSEQLSIDIWTELWQREKIGPKTESLGSADDDKSTALTDSNLWSWVHARCVDQIRRRIRMKDTQAIEGMLKEEQDIILAVRDPREELESELEAQELRTDTQKLVDAIMECPKLTDSEKRLLYCRFYRGMTTEEIGQVIGKERSHVSRLLQQTINKLRQWIVDAALLEQTLDERIKEGLEKLTH